MRSESHVKMIKTTKKRKTENIGVIIKFQCDLPSLSPHMLLCAYRVHQNHSAKRWRRPEDDPLKECEGRLQDVCYDVT